MYPVEHLSENADNGTMPDNVKELSNAVVGHRIVNAVLKDGDWNSEFTITLDNGKTVTMTGTDDCCAGTELESFLLHPERVDHIITGIGTTNGYVTWHIYADMGDVLELTVSWSAGNIGYYGYGFHIQVKDIDQ